MKKLIALALFVAAVSFQSKAQVSFNLSVSSGPAYRPAYYQPTYYAPVRHYYAPSRVVYMEHRRRPVYVVAPRRVYTRTYYRPTKVYYSKHAYKGRGHGHKHH